MRVRRGVQGSEPTRVYFPVFMQGFLEHTYLRFAHLEVPGGNCRLRVDGGAIQPIARPFHCGYEMQLPADWRDGPLHQRDRGTMAASQVLMKTIIHVVGARPNYMKIAPLMAALEGAPGIRQLLVNTGQHYDEVMSTGVPEGTRVAGA